MTTNEMKEVLADLSWEEKEMLRRLPVKEAMLVVEIYHTFPGTRLVKQALGAGPS